MSATYKEVLDAALALANEGLAVFPCHIDKRPATPHGFKDASADPEAVRRLWEAYTAPLIGIATGAVSDLAVLDIDAKHAEAKAWWAANRERLPATRTIRTRSGGLHLWFRHAPGLKCSAGVIEFGIDVRADGGYVIAWHAAGLPILRDAPLAQWPEWLAPKPPAPPPPPAPAPFRPRTERGLRRKALRALECASARVASAPQGMRNVLLNKECFSLGRFIAGGALSPDEIAGYMVYAGLSAGLSEREVVATVASALRARGAA